MSTQIFTLIQDRNPDLRLEFQTSGKQLLFKAVVIDRLKQSWPQMLVDFNGPANDLVSNVVNIRLGYWRAFVLVIKCQFALVFNSKNLVPLSVLSALVVNVFNYFLKRLGIISLCTSFSSS